MTKILFLGDICGSPGREAVLKFLPDLILAKSPDLVIANGENASHGDGVTPEHLPELRQAGIDFFTGGNHSFSKKHRLVLEAADPLAIRPLNFPKGAPGRGYRIVTSRDGKRVLVVNLHGRAFMREHVDCPFRAIEELLTTVPTTDYDFALVDYHGEATSEKQAMYYHLRQFPKVQILLGTHTHVQTNDARVEPETGLLYLTDAGMCGAYRSVIGLKPEPVLERMISQLPYEKAYDASGGLQFNACLCTVGVTKNQIELINLYE